MPERLDDRDLERTLGDLGARLLYPSRDLWPGVRDRIARRGVAPWWSRLVLPSLRPALATLAVVVVLAFLPVLLTTATQVLGLPAIQIYRTPENPTPRPTQSAVPTFAGQRVATLSEASALAGFAVRTPSALGDPDAIYVETAPVRVTLVYLSAKGIPVSPQAGVSALVVEVRGRFDQTVLGKSAGPETKVETVPLNGSAGYWLSGQPHQFFYFDPNGNFQQETLRLAGNTLLWEQSGVTYRLEAELSKEEAVRIASTLR